MQGEISFAGKVAFNIKMDDIKKRILEDLETKFHFKVIQRHFDKYEDHMINKLNNNPHLISVRTNGNPYLLYLTKFNFVNQCIFIDKKIQQGYYYPRIILSKFRFQEELFHGTLFDGEMVKDNEGKWIFIINDIIGHKGIYLENVNLVKRLNIIYNILQQSYINDEYDVCYFQVKKYFKYEELEDMIIDFIPKLKYSCRGIYFKPLYLKFKDILYNFDDSLIQKVMRRKFKSVSNFLLLEETQELPERKIISKIQSSQNISNTNNKEFFVKKTSQPDVYEILENKTDTVLIACIPSLKASKLMRQIFADKNLTDKVLMECEYNEKFSKWMPIKVVPAKS